MRLIIFSLFLILAACRKDKDSNQNIEGNWIMVEVRDIASGDIQTKPAVHENDVEMNLNYEPGQRIHGDVSGHTLSNAFGDGSFSTPGKNQIDIEGYSITDAMETPWGDAFLDNIVTAHEYDFNSSGRLRIRNNEKILVFKRK